MAHNYNTTTHKMQRLPHSASITLQFPNHTTRLTHSPDLYHMYTTATNCCVRAHTDRDAHLHTHIHAHTHKHTHTHTQRRAHTCTHTCIHTTTSPPAQVAVNDHHECKFYNCAVDDLKKHHQRKLQRVKTTHTPLDSTRKSSGLCPLCSCNWLLYPGLDPVQLALVVFFPVMN